MAETPDVSQSTSAPAPAAAPTSAPDLGALNQPGPSAAPDAASIQSQMAPFQAKEQAATQKAADLANQGNAPAKPVPHARLLSMVQGLADGLSSFGTAIATHGREGGAPEVQQLEGQRQQQQQQEQAAATTQRNAQIQQQLMVADTNHKLAQNVFLMGTLPNDIAKSNLEVSGAKQQQAITGADFQSGHGGMTPEQYSEALGSMAPASGQAGAPGAFFRTTAEQQLGATAKVLGADDPYVQKLQAVIANPQATPKDLLLATTQLKTQQAYQEQATDALTKKEAADVNAPLGSRADALNAAMLERYRVLNPAAKALPAGLDMDADSTPKDFDRADKVLQQTESAEATKANRDIVNGMRAQTLALSGLGAPGGDLKLSGDAYLKSLTPSEQSLVSEIGSGKAAPARLDYLLSRNPKLMAEVGRAFPDWDSSKAAGYPATYKDYTSGKTSIALNAGGTALGHLSELQKLNTPLSHVPHTPEWTAYQNKANTVSAELAKFYGTDNIPGVESIRQSLTSTLPGNRESAIQTQATSMGDKLDAYEQEWKNAAPSKAYEAPMPNISDNAKIARAALDPTYAARLQQEKKGGESVNNLTVTAPDGSIHTFKDQQGVDTFKKLAGIQ